MGASGRDRRGPQPGLTTDERQRLKELERENRELRRANEILKLASARSRGQRNTFGEDSRRCLVAEGLARSVVECRSNHIEVGLAQGLTV